MDSTSPDFSFSMTNVDRQAFIIESAHRLDALRGSLGTERNISESPEGAFIRAFLQDNVEFAASPIIERITNTHFLQHQTAIPVRFEQMQKHYSFYWFEPTMILFPRKNWNFHRLEVLIEFNPDTAQGTLRPTAYQILPDKKFQSSLSLQGSLDISLNENFEFQAHTGSIDTTVGPMGGKIDAGVGAKATSNLGFTVGPFVYQMKRVQIDHTAVGAQKVVWRLNGTEFFQENTPRLVVIVQVPKGIRELKIAAKMQAYHHMNFPSSVLEALQELPRILQNFFLGGTPIQADTQWDVSSRL